MTFFRLHYLLILATCFLPVVAAEDSYIDEEGWVVVSRNTGYPEKDPPKRLRLEDCSWKDFSTHILKDNCLEELWLWSVTLPEELGQWGDDLSMLTALTHVSIGYGTSTPEVITQLARAKALTSLSLQWAHVTANVAIPISKLTKLRSLDVSYLASDFGAKNLETMVAHGGITSLALRGPSFNNGDLSRLLKHCSLHALSLHGTLRLSHDDYKSVAAQALLTSLELGGTSPTDEDLSVLGCLKLTSLTISTLLNASDDGIAALLSVLPLRELNLTLGKQISGSFLKDLGKAADLSHLTISAHGKDPLSITPIKDLHALQWVQLVGSRVCIDSSLAVLTKLSSLKEVRLVGGDSLSKEAILRLASSKSITSIWISLLRQFTLDELHNIHSGLVSGFGDRKVSIWLSRSS